MHFCLSQDISPIGLKHKNSMAVSNLLLFWIFSISTLLEEEEKPSSLLLQPIKISNFYQISVSTKTSSKHLLCSLAQRILISTIFNGIWAIPLFSNLPHQNHPGGLLWGEFAKRSKWSCSITTDYMVFHHVMGSPTSLFHHYRLHSISPSYRNSGSLWFIQDIIVLREFEDFIVFYYRVSGFFQNKHFLLVFYWSFPTVLPNYYQILISNFLDFLNSY